PLCRPQIPTRRCLRFLLNCYPRLVSIPYSVNIHWLRLLAIGVTAIGQGDPGYAVNTSLYARQNHP
ncbi:hypothetical protein, partial [Marinobacter salarius]|uniref:hypothetical protein n=1 Tax=Marinobacter salarius TaxID=1420917 RepID=UPI00241F55CF